MKMRRTADGVQITPGMTVFVNATVLGYPPTAHVVDRFHEDKDREIFYFRFPNGEEIGAKCLSAWACHKRAMLFALMNAEIHS